jgi:2-polyprenyl-3-methyl-5-hydroxy-6-metoxy-1,4-benzoquinol methylase
VIDHAAHIPMSAGKGSIAAVCEICGGKTFQFFADKGDARYIACDACGSLRQYPYPDEQTIARFYANYKTAKSRESPYLSDDGYAGYQTDKNFTFNDLKLGPSEFNGKDLLDVGCATGQFVRYLGEARFGLKSAKGIDVSEECVAFARERNLHCAVEDFLSIRDSFDVISMWHLVEHLPVPATFFRHAYRLLRPGGLFLVETPIVGIVAQSFGSDWRFLMPVEHLNLFSQNALFALAARYGFQVRSFVSFGSGNTSGTVPPSTKRAMDKMVKKLGCGDVLATLFVKPSHA